MLTLTIPTIKQTLHSAYKHKRPLMIWGPPGGGKSDGVHQFAQEIDAHELSLHLASYDSVDIHGLPDLESALTYWKPPATMPFKMADGSPNPNFPTDKPIVLFLDEVTSASTGVFSVLYQLVLEGRVNEHELMDNVYIVLAGNREGDRGVVNRMPTPLLNRLTHVEAIVDHEAWVYDYAIPNNLPPIGIAFIQFKPSLLMTFDPTSAEKVFSTPRSYAEMLRMYGDPDMPDLVRQAMVHGTVGSGVATEFLAFAESWQNMIPVAKVLAEPDTCPLPAEDDLSTRWSMAVAISGAMDSDTAQAAHTYLTRLGTEMTTVAWSMAMRRDARYEEKHSKAPDKPVDRSPAYLTFAKEYRSIWAG